MHYVSRHPHLFSSVPSIVINDQAPELSEFFGSIIVMDDPRHLRLRNIVSRAFTPRVVARTEESVRDRATPARRRDDRQATPTERVRWSPNSRDRCRWQVICDMMGIPEEDHEQVFRWTNVILGFGDPDIATELQELRSSVSMEFGAYATALAEDRRTNPRDDSDERAWCRRRSTASS